MAQYQEHLNEILQFIKIHHKLVDCHLVDFISEDLWEKCLNDTLRQNVEDHQMDGLSWTDCSSLPVLDAFLEEANSLSLASKHTITSLEEFFDNAINDSCTSEPLEFTHHKNTSIKLMNVKKQYEVQKLGIVVANLAKLINGLVIDAGAGKAYLSTYLSVYHKVPVLAIDSSSICQKGAMRREKKLNERDDSHLSNVRYVLAEICEKTDYTKLVNENFVNWRLEENLILTGLHTCGSLAHSTIKSFLGTKDFKFLCIMPCCYHLASDTFGKSCSFSKNARMLAQQSLERSIINKSIPSVLFYRAVLQVLLRSMGLDHRRVGRGGPTSDFPSYARWALLRIGIEASKMPSSHDLELLYSSHAAWKMKFDTFQMMRVHMGPIIEAGIILDRMVYLQNSGRCSKLAILRLFDPLLSPRCYAILAMK